MGVMDEVKEVTENLSTIAQNGASIVQNASSVASNLNSNDNTPLEVSGAYISTTKRMAWFTLISGSLLFYIVAAAMFFKNIDLSFILPYVVGLVVPIAVTYFTKSYFEKKNNVPNADMINNNVSSSNTSEVK